MKAKDRVFNNVTSQRSKTMSKIRGKESSIEVALRKALFHKGYRYRKNYKKLPGSPDVAITKYKIAIFCDSEFFHGKDWGTLKPKLEKGNNNKYWVAKIEENMARDRRVDKELENLGWKAIHFWGKEIQKELDKCISVIEEAILEIIVEEGN